MRKPDSKDTCRHTNPTGSLRCDRRVGHAEPHRDPVTGTRWNHPAKTPYMRPFRSKPVSVKRSMSK